MSEEILRALMQLFAIVAKQDNGASLAFRHFVESFLKNQVSKDKVKEYLVLYDEFLVEKKADTPQGQEIDSKPKLTSVKDSVRTLGICKKINKTLVQKQKAVVLCRLFEMVNTDNQLTAQRMQIINTVSEVFNISENEEKLIRHFVISNDPYTYPSSDLLVISDQDPSSDSQVNHKPAHGLDGFIVISKIQSAGLYFLKYEGHSEIFLNGLPVQQRNVYILAPGSTIRLPRGTIYYSEVVNCFTSSQDYIRLKFSATDLDYTFPNGKKALHGIRIEEKSGTLVGIMGASGAGKTTLLNTLCGLEKPSAGSVTINDVDFFTHRSDVEGLIGYIAQDDLLFEELTVYQNLYYNAELCFKNHDQPHLHKIVLQTLQSLGLYEIRDVQVGTPLNKKISGGQRKRLNIALELIREPAILFVDEPTSGLSSRDSENVMDLLKELTQKGKLIFVVIHQPSSDIFKMFDKLILLDVGGYQIYYGNPVEGIMYFKRITNQINSDIGECETCGNVNPELIFNLIESKEVDEYGVFTEKRKFSPLDWHELYTRKMADHSATSDTASYEKPSPLNNIPGRLKQWIVFMKRDLFTKTANKQYILINLLEVPALAFFLSLLIRYTNQRAGRTYSYFENENIPAYFFMSILVALLVGLTVSAEEIYKDQKILKREKFLKLSRFAYLISKVFILFSLSALQAFLLCVVGNLVLAIPGGLMSFYLVVFSVFCSANLLGLILSSTFNSPVTIYIIIPLIIIPQMLLGGAMFRYSRLNSLLGGGNTKTPPLASVMVSRWAYEAVMTDQFKNNPYEKKLFVLDKLESNLNYRVSYLYPKLDELIEIRTERDTMLSKEEKGFIDAIVRNTLADELQNAKEKYGQTEAGDDTLKTLKELATAKYNFIINKKDSLVKILEDEGITKEVFSNKNIQEAVTNGTEMDKIVIDSVHRKFVQIVDPIFRERERDAVSTGLGSPMFSSTKYVFNAPVSTYVYNLFVIWLINMICFILLYTDVLKKVLSFKKQP
ncbi:MAG: ATP-binding cassette domain-containing protein [Bacteroidetes bacterium]|nr:ATP-binding cassette domain-containing protein [Bacteroidota bacterium]